MRQAGLELMQLVMDEEVRELAGERYQRRQGKQPYCWGHEKGFLVADGQKAPIRRPRLRTEQGHTRVFATRRRVGPRPDGLSPRWSTTGVSCFRASASS